MRGDDDDDQADEVPVDDTSEPETSANGDRDDDRSEAGSTTNENDDISLAATENELLEKVREWFYVLLGSAGLAATLCLGLALYGSQHASLRRAFHLLLPAPTAVSFRPQVAALEQVAAQRVRGEWPRAFVPHLLPETASEWLDQTSILPIVWQRDRLSYEAYSVDHVSDWLVVETGGAGAVHSNSNNPNQNLMVETLLLDDAAEEGSSSSSVVSTARSLLVDDTTTATTIHSRIFDVNGNVSPEDRDFYLPLWQTIVTTATTTMNVSSSTHVADFVNIDVQSTPLFGGRGGTSGTDLLLRQLLFSLRNGTTTAPRAVMGSPQRGRSPLDALLAMRNATTTSANQLEPWVPILLPIRAESDGTTNDEAEPAAAVQAVVLGVFSWRRVLQPLSSGYLSLEVATTCADGTTNGTTTTSYDTYRGAQGKLIFVGTSSSSSDQASSHRRRHFSFLPQLHKTYTILADDDNDNDNDNNDDSRNDETNRIDRVAGRCNYTLHLSPSPDLYRQYVTWYSPLWYAVIFWTFAGLVGVLFHGYDVLVEERQKIVLTHSVQADAILSSLFPRQVRNRLLRRNSNASAVVQPDYNSARVSVVGGDLVEVASSHRIKHFLTTSSTATGAGGTGAAGGEPTDSPIADLFPNCTGTFLTCHD
jgi:hypothetical protein